MPYKTGIRLPELAGNGANDFPARLLVAIATAAIAFFVWQWLLAPSVSASNPGAPLAATPALVYSSEDPPDEIDLGESFDLEISVAEYTGEGDRGGISVSFPGLTNTGGNSSSYDSTQGKVETISYTNGVSMVTYHDKGDQIYKGTDTSTSAADYLLVESDDDDWPSRTGDDYEWRTLKLRVTPKQTGEFKVYYRVWLCGDGYQECDRRPRPEHSDQEDQQRWAVDVITVDVTNPVTETGDFARDPDEDFNTLDAAGNDSPEGIWSDGTTMWVVDDGDGKVYAYNLSTKARDSAKDFNTLDAAGNDSPTGIWSDDTTMWVADYSDDKIYAYSMDSKARDSAKDFETPDDAGNDHPTGIWSDGTTMWVADYSDEKIYAYSMDSRARVSSKDFNTLEDAENEGPEGIWSDGATMWVVDYSDEKIYAYNLSTKARVSSKDFDTLEDADNESPAGLWSDRTTVWVADSSDSKIYAYNAPDMAPAPVISNRSPSVSIVTPSSPVSVYTEDSQTFQVSATDSDSNMTKWKWEVDKHFSLFHGHQEPEETFTATGSITKSFSHTFPDNGTYTVTVTFTDSDGESGTAEWRVEVEDPPNRAPSVSRVSPSAIDYLPTGDVTFTATANDPDDNLKRYEWFVDGTSEDDGSWLFVLPTGTVTKDFTHTFSTAGEYAVQVTFTDDDGLSSSISWTITAVDPITMQLGAASYTVNEDDGEVDITVTLSASPPQYISARLRTYDGTAENHSDYRYLSGSASFSSGTTILTQTFPVTIVDDSHVEAAEEFTVELEPSIAALPSYVSLTRSEATVTVHDDDEATVGFEHNRLSVSEARETFHTVVEVESDSSSACPVAVPFEVHLSHTAPDGTSSSGPSVPSSVTFEFCQTRSGFLVDIDDLSGTGRGLLTGPTEAVFTLDSVTSADSGVASRVKIGGTSTQTVTIQDDDFASVRFKRAYSIAREREQFDLCVTTRVDSPTIGRPVTVHFSYADPDGALSTGSTAPSSVRLNPGDTEGCATIHVGDVDPPAASVVFTLDSVTSAVPDVASRIRIDEHFSTSELEVIDQDGQPGPEPANHAPTVTRVSPSSSLTVAAGSSRTFTARANDPDDNLTNWDWSVDGTSEDSGRFGIWPFYNSPTGSVTRSFSRTFSTTGSHTVTVTFTDADGASDSEEWTVQIGEGQAEAEIMSCGSDPASPEVKYTWTPVAEITNHSHTGILPKKFYVEFTISDPVRGLALREVKSETEAVAVGSSQTFRGEVVESWPEDDKEQRVEDGSHQLPLFPLKWFPGEIDLRCELKSKDLFLGDELLNEDTVTVTVPDFHRSSADAKVNTCSPSRQPVLSGEEPTLQANTTYLGSNKGLTKFAVEYWVHHEELRVHHSGDDVEPDSSIRSEKESSSGWRMEEWERPRDWIDLDSQNLPVGTYTLDCALWGHRISDAYKRFKPGNVAYNWLVTIVQAATNPIQALVGAFAGPLSPKSEVQIVEREFSKWRPNDPDYSLQGLVSTRFSVVETRWEAGGLSIERGIETLLDGRERIRVRVSREEAENRVGGRIRAPNFHVNGPELEQTREATRCGEGDQDHGKYLSLCWETTFDIPVNDTINEREYSVRVESHFIDDQTNGFTVEVSPDAAGLRAFYDATGGPNWVNKNGWLSNDPIGDWYGVDTNAGGRVVKLDLRGSGQRGNGLQGPLPSDLKDTLPFLHTLYLGGNSGLTECVREDLLHVKTNDLKSLDLPTCEDTCAWGGALPDPNNQVLVADCEALLAARDTLTAGQPSGRLNWSAREPIGTWRGVVRGGNPERVIKLEIEQPPRLWGYFSRELAKLSSLQVLTLANAGLRGEIPEGTEGPCQPAHAGPPGQPADRGDSAGVEWSD